MKKLGIALAGGGARGAYQIGAWKALKEHGIDQHIKAYSGASVGSLNATLMAIGNFENAYETWMSLERTTLFNLEKKIYKRIFKEKLNFLNRGIYGTKKLEKLMRKTLEFEKIKGKEVYVSTTKLGDEKSTFFDLIRTNYKHYFKSDLQVHYQNIATFDEDQIVKTLLASCAIPIAFQPVQIEKQTFYDGGILDNTPYQPLLDAGCDVIIVIDLFTFSPMRIKKIPKAKVITVYPRRSLRGILDFSPKYTKRRFDLGYNDMLKHIDQIKELL